MIVIDDGYVWWLADAGPVQQALHPIWPRREAWRESRAVCLLTSVDWCGCASCPDWAFMLCACSLFVCTDGSRTVWMPNRGWEIGRWTRRSSPLAWRHWHGTSVRLDCISGYVCCRCGARRCLALPSEMLLVLLWRASLSCTPACVQLHSCPLVVSLDVVLQVTDCLAVRCVLFCVAWPVSCGRVYCVNNTDLGGARDGEPVLAPVQ